MGDIAELVYDDDCYRAYLDAGGADFREWYNKNEYFEETKETKPRREFKSGIDLYMYLKEHFVRRITI